MVDRGQKSAAGRSRTLRSCSLAAALLMSAVRPAGNADAAWDEVEAADDILRRIGQAAGFTVSERCGPPGCAPIDLRRDELDPPLVPVGLAVRQADARHEQLAGKFVAQRQLQRHKERLAQREHGADRIQGGDAGERTELGPDQVADRDQRPADAPVDGRHDLRVLEINPGHIVETIAAAGRKMM